MLKMCPMVIISLCPAVQLYLINLFPEELFDEDGCYDPKNYMAVVNRFGEFQSFSDIVGKLYKIIIYIQRSISFLVEIDR